MIDILYSEFINKNDRNAVTIKKISKSDNKVYLEGDRSNLPNRIGFSLVNADMSINVETLIQCVMMNNGLHITNPSLLKEFFIKSEQISNSIKTMKDYLKNHQINYSKFVNDNLLMISHTWKYQCGPDGESDDAGYEMLITLKDNKFHFIFSLVDANNFLYLRGNTCTFDICLRLLKADSKFIERYTNPNTNWRHCDVDIQQLAECFKQADTQLTIIASDTYWQYRKNILNN